MKDYIKLIPQLSGESGLEKIQETAVYYDNCGADELFYYDAKSFAEGEEEDVKTIQAICRNVDIPLNVFAKVKRFEDVKKMIYAGAKRVIIKTDGQDNLDAVREASERFGADRVYLYMEYDTEHVSLEESLIRARTAVEEEGFGGLVLAGDYMDEDYAKTADFLAVKMRVPVFIMAETTDAAVVADLLKMSMESGLIFADRGEAGDITAGTNHFLKQIDCMEMKQYLKEQKLPVNTFESAICFEDFKLISFGIIPVFAEDYKTTAVLKLAYKTRESFEKTVATGKMTYYSRSRQELWTEGETSGHFQYVKSLTLDCDNDTILAKVAQVGAACHTGNYTCFFKELVRKEYDDRNPLAVFEDVFATILDRKEHPKEGSYTNYLFDKGIDKILKKVGEEATEIVIAAKNPDSEELKYEICDFLYHVMVLMAERDITWKDITDELAQRH
ncbi:MAG: bifunctional phosphoribosyl-AMP cyclohydrolase/phosphoribosyl-ATP diphosphatase HisIE [Clostridiales bacterium]|nr:bifunctional phosphoribosyl-AMP cyclohydrolase/phosphoribosyl-ATP diphosphatase HisIE [Clostridiales bacterium]